MTPYIQPHTADTPAVLISPNAPPYPIDPQMAVLMIKTLADYIFSHNVVVLDGRPCACIEDE